MSVAPIAKASDAFYSIASQSYVSCVGGQLPAAALCDKSQITSHPGNGMNVSIGDTDLPRSVRNSEPLFGINGGEPFFSSAQVFYTATGPRALEPELAKTLLPVDTEVGPLFVGHVLFRLKDDGKSYHQVAIGSFSSSSPDCDRSIVDLRGGSSLYHVNGFLAISMQPDVQLQDTARALQSLSAVDRMVCLHGVSESRRAFHRLGADGVSQLLERELAQKTYIGPRRRRPLASKAQPLSHAKRTYQLSYRSTQGITPSGVEYNLPSVNIFEGVVSIDNEPIRDAKVDSKDQSIRWTRPINSGFFEHGFIGLFDHGLSGTGSVAVSSNESEDSISNVPQQCIAQIHARTTQPSSFTASEQQFGTGDEDRFEMILDLDPWPKTEASRTEPANPSPFGLLVFDSVNIGGEDGLDAPVVRLPHLDSLCEAINGAMADSSGSGQQKIDSLYTSTLNLAGRSDSEIIIKLNAASLLQSIADPFSLATPYNLTFKDKIKTDLVLPMIFQEAHLKFSRGQLTGAMFAYNPEMRGCLGDRHLFLSTELVGDFTLQKRLRTSRAFINPEQLHPTLFGNEAVTHPAPVTHKLADLRPTCVQDLLLIGGYSEPAIHDMVQKLIQNMMLYHIDAKERKELLRIENAPSVPQELPAKFADSLPNHYKAWLKTVYGRAFICTKLCDVQSSSRVCFTEKEKLKLNYFWTGKGATCLSRQKEYNDLMDMATRHAMEQLCPQILSYKSSGEYWAQKTIECMSDPVCIRSLQQTPIEGGVNYTTKLTNTLMTLSPDKSYMDSFLTSVIGSTVGDFFLTPVIGTDDTKAVSRCEDILVTAYTSLGLQVLDKDDRGDVTLDAQMKKDLAEEILALEKASGLPSTGSPSQRMAALVAARSNMFWDLAQRLVEATSRPSSATIKSSASRSGPLTTLTAKGNSGFKLVWDILKSLAEDSGSMGANINLGSLLIISSGFLLYQCYGAVVDWDNADGVDRANFMTNILSSVQDIISQSYNFMKSLLITPVFEDITVQNIALQILNDTARVGITKQLGRFVKEISTARQLVKATESRSLFKVPKETPTDSFTLKAESPYFNETVEETAAEAADRVAPACEATFEKMNGSQWAIEGAFVLINIAVVVVMSLQLHEQWDQMDGFDRAANVIQISIVALTVIFSKLTAEIIFDLAEALGIALDAQILNTIPGIGTILAIIGVVIGIIVFLVDLLRPKPPPPPTPEERFISQVGQPLIAGWLEQRNHLLSYDMPQSLNPGRANPTRYTITVTNRTGQIVTLSRVTFKFQSGTKQDSLFSNTEFDVVPITDPMRNADGRIYVDLSTAVNASVSQSSLDGTTAMFEIHICGAWSDDNPDALIMLWPGYGFAVTVTGNIQGQGVSTWAIVEDLVEPSDSTYFYRSVLITGY